MKYLNWLKNNINVVSFCVGFGLLILGDKETGLTLIRGGL